MNPGSVQMLEPDAAPRLPGRRARRRRIVVALLLATTLGLTAVAGYAYWALGGTAAGAQVRIIVPEGANAGQIADELQRRGVVRSAFMFRLVSRMRGTATVLKPGAYDLRKGLGVSEALDRLREGIPLEVFRFTIPEGKTLREISRIIDSATPIGASELLAAAREADRPSFVPAKVPSLEGLLFPETYNIDEETTAGQTIDLLLRQFEDAAEEVRLAERAKALGVTPYQAVIIASLIEREAQGDHDRNEISSVIYNRIERGMRLEIDATVQYAIEQETGTRKGERLTSRDNRTFDSPYNTYRISGLPPTPIASPGLASLRAAVNPATTDYLFYRVSKSTGRHCFGRTLAEHNRCAR